MYEPLEAWHLLAAGEQELRSFDVGLAVLPGGDTGNEQAAREVVDDRHAVDCGADRAGLRDITDYNLRALLRQSLCPHRRSRQHTHTRAITQKATRKARTQEPSCPGD
jgi:hypothetical protein